MLGLSLLQEHSSLLSLLYLFCQFLLLDPLGLRLLLLFLLVLIQRLGLSLGDALLLALLFLAFLSSLLFLLFGEFLPVCHDDILLIIYRFLELLLLFYVGLPASFLFLTLLSLDIIQTLLELVQRQLF